MKFRTQKELFEYYASVPYTPKARPPKLSETDSGDEALEKMLIFIPPEHRKYLLWKSNVRQMLFEDDFGDSMLQDDVIYAVLVCRVSTAGDLQDPRSSIDQLAELIELQERDPKFKIIGVCLDFYKNGRKTKGRLIFDEVIDKLYDMKDSGIRPKFNAISFPELARLSRRPSIIFDTAEHCFFFGLRLMRANDRMDLSDPINIGTLANMAAEAQREIYRLGERIARGKKASFKRFRTQQGVELFGFEVINLKDEKGDIVDSVWRKKENEFNAKVFMYDQFLLTPNFKEVSNAVKDRFGIELKPDRIHDILLDKRSIGIILFPDKKRVLNTETETVTDRHFPLPKAIKDDLTPADRLPWKYYVPEIVCVDVEKYKAVFSRISKKVDNIMPSKLGRKTHKPRRENGKHPLSGLIFCFVGDCREEYILSGSGKYPDYFGCKGRRNKIKKCLQEHYIRGKALLTVVNQGIEAFLLDEFPAFYLLYKEACKNQLKAFDTEISALEDQKRKKEEALMRFIAGKENFNGLPQFKLDSLAAIETESINRIEELVQNRKGQKEFLAMNLPYDQKAVKILIAKIQELIERDPIAANETLKQIIDRIEIHKVEDLNGNSIRIVARVVTRMEQLAPYFSSDTVLKEIFNPNVSIKVPSAIAEPTLIEAEILQNFEVLIPTPRTGGRRAIGSGVLWRFMRSEELPITAQESPWTSVDNEIYSFGNHYLLESYLTQTMPLAVKTFPSVELTSNTSNSSSEIIPVPQNDIHRKHSLSLAKIETGGDRVWFEYNLFTDQLEFRIPKNRRIKYHGVGVQKYAIYHEEFIAGEKVAIPETVERKVRAKNTKSISTIY